MLVSRTLQKPGQLMSVATKVGIQINAKLGGEIWSVQIPVRHFTLFLLLINMRIKTDRSLCSFQSKTLMIVGIDTYRDSQNRSAQMVGFVASINPTCTRYYSRVIEQRTHHDLISGLKQSMQGKTISLSL